MRVIIAALATLLILSFPLATQQKFAAEPPTFFWGTWQIYKLEEVGGHSAEKSELAQNEIGRTIKFGRKAISYGMPFLFFDTPCRSVSYALEVRKVGEYDAGARGTLIFYGLSAARKDQVRNVVVKCGGRPAYYFELTKDNQFAIFYDGWFFFLKKLGG